ncbi:hypothetical protein H1230_15475 [Paenibacillus sp. 19GGS1-52]|uniref:hypothetical protein n=1 Tax=Paenibacillus sp. 19GGS1-52 TaxID=2758563 RepID=UPI001EFB1DB9|nr:hypothetical protein [Paenibacillus sp. 19GGS1-52]ULO10041.1 hypothetical protein H1230_15475 [Paenibacillus sp. 19GGS1-52]
MWKKYTWIISGIIVAVVAVGSMGYNLNSKSTEIKQLTSEAEVLRNENTVIKKESESKAELITGLKNLFPQYVRESESILNELSKVIPACQYNTEEQKQMMDKIKKWIQKNRIKEELGLSFLDQNRVILSLKPLGNETDGSFSIEAMYYEIPGESEAISDYPRPTGKEYVGVSVFKMKKKNGVWEVSQYSDQF